ncbi:MAG: TIGR00282 family metallophosphoesterase [Candidatus Atribacteria bacterium]|nr:TIGR00282 family metallophosphoesterase [Candidatus Atribacteria bacterium]
MRFLIVGDIVGKPGRRIAAEKIEKIKKSHSIDAVIANGENSAGGLGITPETCEELLRCGIDVLTSGNHIWDKKEILGYIDRQEQLLRPLNYPPGVPGRGYLIHQSNHVKWAVVNVSGRVFMNPLDCPFQSIDRVLPEIQNETKIIVIDFHAEATSEKIAFGWYTDGRVSCVVGTHTHVITADERILPGGTAYITDIGMTGAHDSVIGIEVQQIVDRFLTQIPVKYTVAKENVILNGVVVEIDDKTGKAISISRLSLT